MGIIIDPEVMKPLKCTECGSTDIVSMPNEGAIKCLKCGRRKSDPNHWKNIMKKEIGSGSNVFIKKKNPNPHRDF